MALVTVGKNGLYSGMGMYPTYTDSSGNVVANPCYDPNGHPWWYPNLFDTNAESACATARGIAPFNLFTMPGGVDASITPSGGVSIPGQDPTTPGQTISSLVGLAVILGVAYMFLGLYLRKGRY